MITACTKTLGRLKEESPLFWDLTKAIPDLSIKEWSEVLGEGPAEGRNSMASVGKRSSVWGGYAGWDRGG